jgi:hypothetical protein
MATEKVLVAIKGGNKEGKKTGGWGEGKDIVLIERFSIAAQLWQPKTFQSQHVDGN